VANDLGIGKGTVYRYFPSKRALFQATVDHVMIGLRDAVDAAIRDVNDPLDRIERAIRAYLEYFHGHPDGVELLIQERAEFRNGPKPTYWRFRAANVGRWRALYRGLIRGGRIRPVAVGRVTEMVGDLIYGTMFTNHVARRTRSPGKQADDIVDLVFRGLLTPSQRAQSAPREKELRR
jgi:AcrR family transcriptional regulator